MSSVPTHCMGWVMGLDDLLARLERAAGTSGTSGVPADVPAKPLQTLGGTSGTSGTSEKNNAECRSRKCLPSGATDDGTAPTVRAARWLIHFADREPVEVWFAPAADHGEVPAAHPGAVAAEPLPEVRTPVRNEVRKETAVRGCSTCRHRKRPGRSDPGYCGGGRDDLPGAYGVQHPLRKLPGDQGASCELWRDVDD